VIGGLSNPVKLKEDMTELTRPITAPVVKFQGMSKKGMGRAGNLSSV